MHRSLCTLLTNALHKNTSIVQSTFSILVATADEHCLLATPLPGIEKVPICVIPIPHILKLWRQCVWFSLFWNPSFASLKLFTLLIRPEDATTAKELVAEFNARAQLTYEVAGTLTFELPTEDVNSSSVFQFMEQAKNRIKVCGFISDPCLSSKPCGTTFLNTHPILSVL